MKLIKNLSFNHLVLLATIGSVLVLGGAFVFQAFGFAPCKLCLWQRWPHAAAIAIGAATLATQKRLLAWLGAAAATTTSGLGVYHSGVERKLWEGPTTCTSSALTGELDPADLLNQILAAPLVRCDEIPWEMFGVTMANLNALGSAGLAIIWILAARKAA